MDERSLAVTAADLNIRIEDLVKLISIEDLVKLISSDEYMCKITIQELTDLCFALGSELQDRSLKIANG